MIGGFFVQDDSGPESDDEQYYEEDDKIVQVKSDYIDEGKDDIIFNKG